MRKTRSKTEVVKREPETGFQKVWVVFCQTFFKDAFHWVDTKKKHSYGFCQKYADLHLTPSGRVIEFLDRLIRKY